MLFFLAFFLATSLYILPVGFGSYFLPKHGALVFIGRSAAVVVGVYLFFQSVLLMY
jgi:hypothetical protein